MKHKDLFLLHDIFCSDDDAEVVDDIFAGYDEAFNLVILIEHNDYVEHEYNCCAYAVVSKDEAFKLSQRLGVPMTQLIDALANSVKYYQRLVNPTLKQARDCFHDLLKFVGNNGGRLKLYRTYGADGHTCY